MDAAPRTGYRPSQKLLHWLTVLAVAAQFTVGYNLDLDDDCNPPGEDLGGGDTSDAFEDRLDRLEDACEARADDYDLLGGRPAWRRHSGRTSPSASTRMPSDRWSSARSNPPPSRS